MKLRKKCPKNSFLDNFDHFQNGTIMKSALIETALIGDGDYLYKPNIPNLKKNIDISPKIIEIS